jgi:hypothetical protein
MARRNCAFKRADNCFTGLGNVELAQRLLDEQLQTDWPAALDTIARDPFAGVESREPRVEPLSTLDYMGRGFVAPSDESGDQHCQLSTQRSGHSMA